MSSPTITDKYYYDLQINRHVGVFISSFSLLFISFIIGKWGNLWSWFWPGGYKIRAIGDCDNAIGGGAATTLVVHRNGTNTGFHHIETNPTNDLHEIVIEQTTQDYLGQKWYKFHHLHGFAAFSLLIAYILSFLAVSIGVVDDRSTVHTRLFVVIAVFKKIPQVITILLCAMRNESVRDGVMGAIWRRLDLVGSAEKLGAFFFAVLAVVTTGLGIFDVYSIWSCHANVDWDSRKYNESRCANYSQASEIANALISALVAIIADVVLMKRIAGVGPDVYGRRRLAVLNTAVAMLLIAVEIINIFEPSFVSGYYAEVFYIAFLQYTTYMLSFT